MVTGADGFIGSHLTEELVKRGEKVRAFCLYNSFGSLGWIDTLPPEIRNEIDIFMGDVRDPNGVRTAMRGQERVFHLAALIAIPFSYHSPDSYVDTNIKGTLNVLNAARELDTQRVLVTSTSEVYGTAPLQHLWSASERPRHHPHHHHPTAGGPDRDQTRQPDPDPRLQLCQRHRQRLYDHRGLRCCHRSGAEHCHRCRALHR